MGTIQQGTLHKQRERTHHVAWVLLALPSLQEGQKVTCIAHALNMGMPKRTCSTALCNPDASVLLSTREVEPHLGPVVALLVQIGTHAGVGQGGEGHLQRALVLVLWTSRKTGTCVFALIKKLI